MKQELKKITNLTINELLNNEIILPSTYFNKFNYHAKELEINLDDENFKKELNSVMLEELQTIENYMNLVLSSATALQENTRNATNAIINKDVETLGEIYKKMLELENEVKSLNSKLFSDDFTSTFNKKWVYNKFLNTEASFQQNGICVLIDVVDYTYIQKEYGELLSNNLLIFATKFIKQKLKDEDLDFKIVRYYENKFLVFIIDSDENKKEVINSILNLEHILSNTTLKSNSGLFIKAKYKFKISSYKTNQESKEIFERLLSKEQEE